MSLHIQRRTFLRGAAGVALPLPFLNLMKGSTAASESETPPLRFVSLFKPNGVHPPSWNINGGAEHDFRMSPLMKPFEKHKQDLLILDNIGDFGFASHANSSRRFLTGHHANTKSASIDQLIADKIGHGTAHRSLELTTEGLFTNQIGCSYISYDSQGQAIPRESDPQLIFDRLFRSPFGNPQKRREMSSLLDRVGEDARSLARKTGHQDRRTLDEYLEVVRATERRLEKFGSEKPQQHVDVQGLQRPPRAANLNEQVETMLDLIALAMWTDSTRCATYMLGNSNSRIIFDFLGITEQHHYLSHFFRNFSRENLEALLKINIWHMEKFDYLLTKLKSYKDQNGTLLDQSVVLFGSGMGHSDNHTVKRIPMILAGQGGGRLKTGRYLRYSENQPVGKLHLALLNAFGIERDSYAQASEPLAGLSGGLIEYYQERPFDSWVKADDQSYTVQGRLRMSDDLNEARIFYVEVEGRPPVRVDVQFQDFHRFNLAYHCGTPITLTGEGSPFGETIRITKVKELKSLFGKQPGTQNG